MRIAVTGAAGFLGQVLVRAAREAGAEVLALSRGGGVPGWDNDRLILNRTVDLGAADAPQVLVDVLKDTDAVIHAAGSFDGGQPKQARDTVGATAHLVAALNALASPPRLVLVSSFSVYDAAALPDFAVLTEKSPLVAADTGRDAYTRAKRAQEVLVAQSPLPTVIVRPGAIYGPGRLWSDHLGLKQGGAVLCPGGDALVPAVAVEHAAASLVQAAMRPSVTGPINLVDPDPPSQSAWLVALGLRTLYVPRRAVLLAAAGVGRADKWAARFRPLRYDLRRARDQLGHRPARPFSAALTSARGATTGGRAA